MTQQVVKPPITYIQPFAHLTTKNKSFLNLYYKLKEEGVKNCAFFLKLYNPILRGIDPHEKNLPEAYQAAILREIVQNKWYFIREVIRVPVAGGNIPYELNRGNLAITWCKEKNLNSIAILPRQNGKTLACIIDDIWVYHFGSTNTNFIYSNKSLDLSTENLKRFKNLVECLPKFLQDAMKDPKIDTDNELTIESGKRKNSIKVIASALDPSKAEKLGRGLTAACVLFDEFAFLKYNELIYSSASPAQSQARLEAQKNKKPYGKTIITTPSNLDLDEGSYCKSMIDSAAPFDEAMYDWSDEKVSSYISANSTNDFVHIQFSWKQLGRSQEWYEDQCRGLNNNPFYIKREIDIVWTLANGSSIFREEQLEAIDKYIKDPVGKFFVNELYKFDLYVDNFDTELPWLIGVDVAGGLARDDSAITIVHPVTYEIAGTFRNNNVDTAELTDIMVSLMRFYIPNAVAIPERNSYGKVLIDLLIKVPDIVDRVYWEIKEVQAQEKTKDGKVVASKVKTKIYGVNTDTNSRDKMINDILRYVVENEPEKIIANSIYEDIRNLQMKKTGKIEHREGTKDDGLFSYLVVRYIVGYGTNRARFNIGAGSNGKTHADVKKSMNKNMMYLSQQNRREKTNFSLSNSVLEENLAKEINHSDQQSEGTSNKNKFLSILRMNNPTNKNDGFKN